MISRYDLPGHIVLILTRQELLDLKVGARHLNHPLGTIEARLREPTMNIYRLLREIERCEEPLDDPQGGVHDPGEPIHYPPRRRDEER